MSSSAWPFTQISKHSAKIIVFIILCDISCCDKKYIFKIKTYNDNILMKAHEKEKTVAHLQRRNQWTVGLKKVEVSSVTSVRILRQPSAEKGRESSEEEENEQLASIQERYKGITHHPKQLVQKKAFKTPKISLTPIKSCSKLHKGCTFRRRIIDPKPITAKNIISLHQPSFTSITDFISSDLHFLKQFPKPDMEMYVVKIKQEEYFRKKLSIEKWKQFTYQNFLK